MDPLSPSPRVPGSPFASSVEVDVPSFGRCRPRDVWEVWCSAQEEAECAYREWAGAPRHERRRRCARYRAALEREECAARVLSATVSALAA